MKNPVLVSAFPSVRGQQENLPKTLRPFLGELRRRLSGSSRSIVIEFTVIFGGSQVERERGRGNNSGKKWKRKFEVVLRLPPLDVSRESPSWPWNFCVQWEKRSAGLFLKGLESPHSNGKEKQALLSTLSFALSVCFSLLFFFLHLCSPRASTRTESSPASPPATFRVKGEFDLRVTEVEQDGGEVLSSGAKFSREASSFLLRNARGDKKADSCFPRSSRRPAKLLLLRLRAPSLEQNAMSC